MRAAAGTQNTSPVATLYYGDEAALEGLQEALRNERVDVRSAQELPSGDTADIPAVLLVDRSMIARLGTDFKAINPNIVVVAVDESVASAVHSERVALTLPATSAIGEKLRVLRAAYQLAVARMSAQRADRELARTRNELRQLHRIGMALMTERDPETLLHTILEQARALTHSDAGSLYLVEKDEHGVKRLRFTLSQNDTLPDLPLVQFALPIDTASLAGYAAYNAEPLVLADAYAIPETEP